MTEVLSDRQRRELEFYEKFSELNSPSGVNFASVRGNETKVWNSYWRVMQIAKQNFKSTEQRLLDFGCGRGESSILFARIGYEVFGFDLCPNNVAIAQRLASRYEMTERTHFDVSIAERLHYPSDYFDVIIGTDILHHIEIRQALSECTRVLKTGGFAVFHEPVRVPLFDSLRESRLGRWLVPKEVSYDRHVTQDEKKLTPEDLKLIRSLGLSYSIEPFELFSRLDRFIKPKNKGSSFLEKLDSDVFKWFPMLKTFGGIIVITLRKPNESHKSH